MYVIANVPQIGAWRVLCVETEHAYFVTSFAPDFRRCPQAAASDYADWCNRQATLNRAIEPEGAHA